MQAAPAKTPAPIVAFLNKHLNEVVQSAAFRQRMDALGMAVPADITPEKLAEFMRRILTLSGLDPGRPCPNKIRRTVAELRDLHCALRRGVFLPYPNIDFWSALHDGRRVPAGEGQHYVLSVVDCGFLHMPTGRLVACDPFAGLQKTDNPSLEVHSGRYRVLVTLVDVSDANDKSHMREAYATLMLDETAIEATRRIITPSGAGACPPEMGDDGTYHGFPVDAGTACFVDQGAIETLMPDDDWYESIFDDGTPNSWFARMDDPSHIRDGIANIPLPLAVRGENIVIFHSGWGDGHYPVVGGYDASDRLVRVHIDFLVVFNDDDA